jgi:hypothetical protein
MFPECSFPEYFLLLRTRSEASFALEAPPGTPLGGPTECSLNVPWMFPECSLNVTMFLRTHIQKDPRFEAFFRLAGTSWHTRGTALTIGCVDRWLNVPQMFPGILNIPWDPWDTERSLNVPWMFPECSLNVPPFYAPTHRRTPASQPFSPCRCQLAHPWDFKRDEKNYPRIRFAPIDRKPTLLL